METRTCNVGRWRFAKKEEQTSLEKGLVARSFCLRLFKNNPRLSLGVSWYWKH